MYCFLHVNVIHQFFIYRNIYKLSDFGTAKPLNDNDFFASLVGTDEYLVSTRIDIIYLWKFLSDHPI